MDMNNNLTPILVGAGQFTKKDVDPRKAMDPIDLMTEAAYRAADDAGIHRNTFSNLDMIVTVKSFCMLDNAYPTEILAARLGANRATLYHTTHSGSTPQWLVNQTAEQIIHGKTRFALFTGSEAMDTLRAAAKAGIDLKWNIPSVHHHDILGDQRPGNTQIEADHGLYLPVNIYPLFENALRKHYGHSMAEHQQKLGQLFSPFTKVAEKNPYAWFQTYRSPEEISTSSPANRYVGFPYTKYMNAMVSVNQAAAVIMTSVDAARKMGIHESKWVYLQGCADATDHWWVSERVNYHSSPAIKKIGEKALSMAGLSINHVDFLDLYSCFPCVVEITRDMLGIDDNDPRPLTVTGGLPYFGGPGNNYVMHAIAEMVNKLRGNPGKIGLVTGNGYYITKHSIGIYSTQPRRILWERENPVTYQRDLDTQPHPEIAPSPSGSSTIETYTVLYGRDGDPHTGIVIGRLPDGRRFISNTPKDRTLLEQMKMSDVVGASGMVKQIGELNIFSPD